MFTLFNGIFKPGTGFPDGDTVRFLPDETTPLFTLPRKGRAPKVNEKNGTISLRYEGIDSLEKSAIKPYSSDATMKNLELLGLVGPEDEGPGHILSNQIGPNGRPISFVFKGKSDGNTGDKVFLTVEILKSSVNFQILEAGTAYPLFYDTLYWDLRAALAEAAVEARTNEIGFWPKDKTQSGIVWGGKPSLETIAPIFPKLWRRLQKYTQHQEFSDDSATLDNFMEYLSDNPDRLFILSKSRFTDLDNIVEVDGDKVSLPFQPEDLIFES